MITCPNCEKQIADDSAHCGFCGHQLEEKNKKKTMFGMQALGGDELKKAVEQAKEAKKEKEGKKKSSGLQIPKPGQGSKDNGGEKKGLKLPKPGQKTPTPRESKDEDRQAGLAKTERIDLSDASSPEETDREGDDSGETSAPDQAPAQSDAAGQESPGVDDLGGLTEPAMGKPAGPGPSQVSQAGAQSGPFGPGAKQAEEAREAHQGDQQGSQPVQVSRAGSMPGGGADATSPGAQQGSFGQKKFDTTPPGQQPAAHQQNQLQTQGKGKSKKGLIIGIVIATMVLGGGCTLALAYWAYTAFF